MIPLIEDRIEQLNDLCRRHRVLYADTYFGLLEALEELFERPVDLVVESAIKNPYFRQSVEQTKVPLFA